MKLKILFLISIISVNAYSQDTLYVGEFGRKTVPKSQAKYYKIVEKDSLNGLFSETRYDLNGSLKSKGIYEKYNSRKRNYLAIKVIIKVKKFI